MICNTCAFMRRCFVVKYVYKKREERKTENEAYCRIRQSGKKVYWNKA